MIEEFKEKWAELEARKRAELEASFERGDIADPITGAIASIKLSTFLISLAVSASVSAASFALTRALAPKPPRQELGKLTGSLQLQNSEQGIFIPEIYGGQPTTSLVTGSNPVYQNLANVTAGANGAITKTSGGSDWNAGASHNVSISSGQDAFYEFTVGTGYATAGFTLDSSPTSGNADFLFALQWNPDGGLSIKYNSTAVLGNVTTWTTGDIFRLELRKGRFRIYKGSAEIVPPNFIFPTPSYPLFMGIAMQFVGAGVSASKVQITGIGPAPNSGRGGVKVPAIIVWSSGIRKIVTTTEVQQEGGKGGGRTQTVDNISYNIDLGLMFCNRGPYNLIREYANADILIDQYTQSANPSGIYDPTTGPDPDYDPALPPDPTLNFDLSNKRVDADMSFDANLVGTGTIQGGGSGFAVYPGNTTQDPDPTIEADIDAKYGAGSTPAYRNKSLIVHNQLSLSRWGGVAPNITAVWEHDTLRTLDTIFASLCERVGVKAANGDYDFTGITIASRGLVIAGRPFAPKEIIASPEIQCAYNYFVTEAEGQIIAYEEGDEPTIVIPDTEIGWLEGDGEMPDIAPEVESIIAPEISHAREVNVKSIDPDNDWEPNTANAIRQITDGQSVELLEIQITQLSDERRETAQRKLYRDYVAGTAHKFTLPYTYLFLFPGYKLTITRAEGFTHVMRLTSITGGIGLLECEGVALEPETFNQPANGVFPPGYRPPQPIPAMIVMTMLDIPLFREADEGKLGYYAGGTPRTGVNQTFQGWALHSQRNSVWSLRASSELPATIGAVVSATALSDDPDTFDNVGTITIDLYGSSMTLASVTEADVLAGMNRAVVKDFILGFTTATQVAGFPNRWTLSGLLNGLYGTQSLVAGVLTGARFALLDNAIVFVPATIDELNLLLSFRGVASGQSLDDAAEFDFVWTGKNLKARAPSSVNIFQDASGDWTVQVLGAPSSQFVVELWDSTYTVLKATYNVVEGVAHAAMLEGSDYTAGVTVIDNIATLTQRTWGDKNNIFGPDVTGQENFFATARTIEQIIEPGSIVDFTFHGVSTDTNANGGSGVFAIGDASLAPDESTVSLFRLYCSLTKNPAQETLFLQEYGVLKKAVGGPLDWEIRFSVIFSGGELRIYRNRRGSNDEPLYVTTRLPADFPLRLFFLCSWKAAITGVSIQSIPSTVIAARDQVIYFGSVQSRLYTRIYALSPLLNNEPGFSIDVIVPPL